MVARDNHGNTSEESRSWTVTVDNEGPELSISEPQEGQRFFENDSPITVKGKSEEGVDLRVNDRMVMVGNKGEFELKMSLKEGDNQIEAVAIDAAGNETRKAILVNYTP